MSTTLQAILSRQAHWSVIGTCLIGLACQRVTPHPEEREWTKVRAPATSNNGTIPGDGVTNAVPSALTARAPSVASASLSAPETAPMAPTGSASALAGGELGPSDDNAAAPEPVVVKRLSVASGIVNREPVVAQHIRTEDPVFAFLEVANEREQANEVRVIFEHESGKQVGFVDLPVPANQARWRTWAQTAQIRETGQWAAVILSQGGNELGRAAFAVE